MSTLKDEIAIAHWGHFLPRPAVCGVTVREAVSQNNCHNFQNVVLDALHGKVTLLICVDFAAVMEGHGLRERSFSGARFHRYNKIHTDQKCYFFFWGLAAAVSQQSALSLGVQVYHHGLWTCL